MNNSLLEQIAQQRIMVLDGAMAQFAVRYLGE
jgi:methionine synthase I (cobalamin-dependent)